MSSTAEASASTSRPRAMARPGAALSAPGPGSRRAVRLSRREPVVVTAEDGHSRTVELGARHAVTLPGLPRGTYDLTAKGPGFGLSSVTRLSRPQTARVLVLTWLDILVRDGRRGAVPGGAPAPRRAPSAPPGVEAAGWRERPAEQATAPARARGGRKAAAPAPARGASKRILQRASSSWPALAAGGRILGPGRCSPPPSSRRPWPS